MNVVHISLTPLAGAPIRLVECLNQTDSVKARLIVFKPGQYKTRTYPGDLAWEKDREECLDLISNADILHFHHVLDLHANSFGIDFTRIARRGCRVVWQFHSHPEVVFQHCQGHAQIIKSDEVPQLVVGQFQERFYPFAKVVPNLVPIFSENHSPQPGKEKKIVFAPTSWNKGRESRWNTKGAAETIFETEQALIFRSTKLKVLQDVSLARVLRERREALLSIDEVFTGSYHLSSLESLAVGTPVIAYLDPRTVRTVKMLTGADKLPWVNCTINTLRKSLKSLTLPFAGLERRGRESRAWMEKYWRPERMTRHYLDAYQNLIDFGKVMDERESADRRVSVLESPEIQAADLAWKREMELYYSKKRKPGHFYTWLARWFNR